MYDLFVFLYSDFQCFSVRMYNPQSVTVAECPAVCKLKDSDEERDKECAKDSLMLETGGGFAIKIVSPRYDCGLQYRKKEICLYNVSMSCATNDVIVSASLSTLSLSEGDFLDVIDYSQKHAYEKIAGSHALSRDLRILSTRFVVLFSSSNKEKENESGFSLHIECGTKPPDSHGDKNGSADGEEGSSQTEQGSASIKSH